MFYAAASSPEMFSAVKRLVRDTVGNAGLAEQLRHNCAGGTNVLMKASNDREVIMQASCQTTPEPTFYASFGCIGRFARGAQAYQQNL